MLDTLSTSRENRENLSAYYPVKILLLSSLSKMLTHGGKGEVQRFDLFFFLKQKTPVPQEENTCFLWVISFVVFFIFKIYIHIQILRFFHCLNIN